MSIIDELFEWLIDGWLPYPIGLAIALLLIGAFGFIVLISIFGILMLLGVGK